MARLTSPWKEKLPMKDEDAASYASSTSRSSSNFISKLRHFDGITTTAHVAALFSHISFIYLEEGGQFGVEDWCRQEHTNIFGEVSHPVAITTRTGCGTALLGAIAASRHCSALATSNSLPFMVPALSKALASRAPCVLHISASGIDSKLRIVPDYSQVLDTSATLGGSGGIAFLHSTTLQECYDMALAAHMLAFKTSAPVVHFYDGVRTANEMSKVTVVPAKVLSTISSTLGLGEHDGPSTLNLTVKPKLVDAIQDVFLFMKRAMKRHYSFFEYVGAPNAEFVVVALCSQEGLAALTQAVKAKTAQGARFGVLVVRVLRPWSAKHFAQAFPKTARRVAVVASSSSSCDGTNRSVRSLLSDVSASLLRCNPGCQVVCGRFENESGCHEAAVAQLLSALADPTSSPGSVITAPDVPVSVLSKWAGVKATLWNKGIQDDCDRNTGFELSRAMCESTNVWTSAFQLNDSYALGGALSSTHVHFAGPGLAPDAYAPSRHLPSDLLFLSDATLVNSLDLVGQLKTGGSLVVVTTFKLDDVFPPIDLPLGSPAASSASLASTGPGLSSSGAAGVNPAGTETVKQPNPVLAQLAERKVKVYLIDLASVANKDAALVPLAVQIVVLSLVGLWKSEEVKELVCSKLGNVFSERFNVEGEELAGVVIRTLEVLLPSPLPSTTDTNAPLFSPSAVSTISSLHSTANNPEDDEKSAEDEEETRVSVPRRRSSILHSSLVLPTQRPVKQTYGVGGWWKAALGALFPTEHKVAYAQRPNDSDRTYLVKVSCNRRVTPEDYDRNVFHIEFDTTNTGLKYEIGEALGVYGHNDRDEVLHFLSQFDIQPHETVVYRTSSGVSELRTAEQMFTQVLDVFGRPSRRFYTALANFAQDPKEKAKLEKLGGPDGGPEFKKRVDNTTTFADLLIEFTSVKLSLEELVSIIPPIKPRHYSIASSMRMHPTSVHLLVVLVSWEVQGKVKYGQCSRYLEALKVGTTVTVSVKPSVMTLPANPEAPIIMAGLGTGMAPFRAFIQERCMQRAEGIKVGPMVLYLGSRSQFQEYLYGEELEAYNQQGLLTHLRCAFSRDTPKKVYIQHRMQEDSAIIESFLNRNGGSFYLCGPTWPAADVQDAIQDSLHKHAGLSLAEAAERIAEMKEHERYILEVY